MTSSFQGLMFSSRRRFLQRTLSGIAAWQLGFLCVTGARVVVSGSGLIPDYIYLAPYEYARLKA